jgi:hypothetical protein
MGESGHSVAMRAVTALVRVAISANSSKKGLLIGINPYGRAEPIFPLH